MIHIFIYAQNESELRFLHAYVNSYFQKNKQTTCVTATYNAKQALKYLMDKSQVVDICMIDFQEKKVGLAFLLKFLENNRQGIWVMLNQSLDCLLDFLMFRPSGYIPKITEETQIDKTLKKVSIIQDEWLKCSYFSFRYQGETLRIPFNELTYIESSGKKVFVHLQRSTTTYEYTKKLSDIMLPSNFLRCHQSYIVNMDYIKSFHPSPPAFDLFTGESIAISRRMLSETKEGFEKYLSLHK